jgi:ABC-type transport system substrate-binding protein
MAEFDLTKQKQLVEELQRIRWKELPNIKCGEALGLIGRRKEVQNFANYPKWFFWNVWLG